MSGLDLPPFELNSDDSPNLDGASFRSTRAAARPILLPVYVYGIDRRTLRQFKRKLANALNPKAGYCVLTFVEQDGVPRRIQCYYAGGMEGNESADAAGFKWITYGIQLMAMDPWFYGDTESLPTGLSARLSRSSATRSSRSSSVQALKLRARLR
ncbi:phage tail domain-containing protein [Streptomyces sp. INA 01156]